MSARTAAILASRERRKRNRANWKARALNWRARALKAEAMCEWLAEHRTHWEQPNDDVLVHHSRYRADVVPLRLAAAEEAVAQKSPHLRTSVVTFMPTDDVSDMRCD